MLTLMVFLTQGKRFYRNLSIKLNDNIDFLGE